MLYLNTMKTLIRLIVAATLAIPTLSCEVDYAYSLKYVAVNDSDYPIEIYNLRFADNCITIAPNSAVVLGKETLPSGISIKKLDSPQWISLGAPVVGYNEEYLLTHSPTNSDIPQDRNMCNESAYICIRVKGGWEYTYTFTNADYELAKEYGSPRFQWD